MILLILALIALGFEFKKTYVNPTGTYKLVSKIKKQKGEIYGYSGTIQVKTLRENRIAITFMVNKGAPSYNSGSFIDTLAYNQNRAAYTNPELDKSCKIILNFSTDGIAVNEKTANFNSGCGFGHAVIADGYYKKTSSKTPILTDPLTGEKLKK